MAVIEAAPAGGDASLGASWVGGVSPQPTDDVLLGAASGNITITGAPNWNSLESAEGYKGTLKQSAGIAITLKGKNAAGWTWRWQGGTFTRGGVSTQVGIESSIAGNYKVRGGGQKFGTLKLVGSTSAIVMILEDVVKAGEVKLEGGKIDANGFNQEWEGGFATAVAKTKILNIEGITVKISGTGSVWVIGGSNVTLEGTTSTLEFTDPTATTKTVKMGELTTYGNIRFTPNGGAKLKIEESFTCKGFGYTVGEAGATKKLIFKEGITVTIGEFLTALPEPMGNILLQSIWESNVAGKPFFIKGTGGIYPGDYLSLKDSHASGGTFYAGSHGTNTSGNEGWIFQTYHAKTLTATQSSTPSFGPTIDLRTLSATQSQAVTFGPTIDYRKLTVTQAQAVVFSRAVARALTLTQAQAVTRTATLSRALTTTTQGQAAALAHLAFSKLLTVGQGQAVPGGEHLGHQLNRTFSVTQASSVRRVAEVSRTLGVAQSSVAERGQTVSTKTLAVTQVTIAQIAQTIGRHLSSEQSSTTTVRKEFLKSLALEQGQAISQTPHVSRTFALGQEQEPSHSEALKRTLRISQATSVTMVNGKLALQTLTASQSSTATVFGGGLSFRLLTTGQSTAAALSKTIARHLRVSQSSTCARPRTSSHTLAAAQTSSVSYVARIGKPIPTEQASAATVSKALTHSFTLEQASYATVVGSAVVAFVPGHLTSSVDVRDSLSSSVTTEVLSSSEEAVMLSSNAEGGIESDVSSLQLESSVD